MKSLKKSINIFTFFSVLFSCLISCENRSQSDLFYSVGDKEVRLVLENNVTFLIIGKSTKAKLETKNINNQNFIISGSGLGLNKADKERFKFTITPPSEKHLVDSKLEIHVKEFSDNSKEVFTHTFLIPVKSD